MEFLNELGINNIVINELYNIYSEDIINNALLSEEKIISSIIYLKKNGSTNIDKLLLYNLPFFFQGVNKLSKKIDKETIIKLNNDYHYIDEINSL